MRQGEYIVPPPIPLPYPKLDVLAEKLEDFLPQRDFRERILRTRLLKVLKFNKDAGIKIWTGAAIWGCGLHYHKQGITTVEELLFIKVDDLKLVSGLGDKFIYLNQRLQEYGLRMGMAVPCDNYD